MKELDGRVALVTGASGGLGQALALALAQRGTHLALSGRDVEALERLVGEARGHGVRAVAMPMDLTDLGAVAGLVCGPRPPWVGWTCSSTTPAS